MFMQPDPKKIAWKEREAQKKRETDAAHAQHKTAQERFLEAERRAQQEADRAS